MQTIAPSNPLRQAILRGLRKRCPNCGKGRLFRAYLKQVDHCADCGESFADIRADDGPAWLTVLVAGHIVVAVALLLDATFAMPVWASTALFSLLALACVLVLLPRAKGIFISAIWAMKAPGIGLGQ